MKPIVATAIRHIAELIDACPVAAGGADGMPSHGGASKAEIEAYHRDVIAPAVAWRDRVIRTAEREHARVLGESSTTLRREIAEITQRYEDRNTLEDTQRRDQEVRDAERRHQDRLEATQDASAYEPAPGAA